jgi:hypothetical protein
MSIKAMSRVWDESPRKGSALLLLLAIADFANDEGAAWPSVDTLAKKCRMSRRNVQTLAGDLATDGDITIQENAGPNGCNIYRLARITRGGANFASVQTGDASARRGGANQRRQSAHKPSGTVIDPSGTPAPADAGSDAAKPKSEHQELIDGWTECFEAQFGTRYVVLGGADGKAAKGLLSATKLPASKIIEVACAAWAKRGKGFWACENKTTTIRDLYANWNRIVQELNLPAVGDIPGKPLMDRITKAPPEGLKPEYQRPRPGYDESGQEIGLEEWDRRYPITDYYDAVTLEPLTGPGFTVRGRSGKT